MSQANFISISFDEQRSGMFLRDIGRQGRDKFGLTDIAVAVGIQLGDIYAFAAILLPAGGGLD
ncbi:hypothetical protein HJA93_25135 [Rhizobium binae]|nr:hypothetical protein [Rhizobium binae]